jgi:hypothetical protein
VVVAKIAHQPDALVAIERNAVVQRVPAIFLFLEEPPLKVLWHAVEPIAHPGAVDR